MFIKGTKKDGSPVHFTAEEKLKEGIRRMVSKSAPKGFYQYAEELVITDVRVIPGSKEKKEVTRYSCKGTFRLKRGNTANDTLRSFPDTYTCEIHIKDAVDEHNIPDIAAVEFKSSL